MYNYPNNPSYQNFAPQVAANEWHLSPGASIAVLVSLPAVILLLVGIVWRLESRRKALAREKRRLVTVNGVITTDIGQLRAADGGLRTEIGELRPRNITLEARVQGQNTTIQERDARIQRLEQWFTDNGVEIPAEHE